MRTDDFSVFPHPTRHFARLAAVLAILFFLGPAKLFSAENSATLTNIASIRALTTAQAEQRHPVILNAIVTFSSPGGLCFVQDDTGSIFIRRKADSLRLQQGQSVEIRGVTLGGDWAPVVLESGAKVLGEGQLPPPEQVPFDELVSGKADCRWVEIEGIVRVAKPGGDHLHLELAVGGDRMRAYIYEYESTNYSRLVNSRIRMRGAVGSIFNHKKQFAAPLLFVSGAENFRIEEPSSPDPFDAPLRPTSTLLQWSPGTDYGHRVKVSGVVTYQERGQAIFIRDGTQGLRVQTSDSTEVKPGQLVEAVGFPVMGRYTPALEDALFRVVGPGETPKPVKTTVEEALSGLRDADLVTLEAQMLDLVRRGNERILILQASNVIFNAHLPANAGDLLAGAERGSRLQVTGICSIQEVRENVSFLNPQSFELLLRSARDVAIVQRPPFWTLSRLMWILAAMGVVMLAGAAWAIVLNRRVKEQTEIIHHRVEREAVLEERSRIAREFHDTLEQELAGISLQLDTVAVHLKTSPALATQQLELARNLSRHTLAEARRSVWDLRSHLLENSTLAAALTELARQVADGSSTRISVQTSGTARKLTARVENNLLRIAQEALANALKHADAKNILVQLDYAPEKVRLCIRDDGTGFDVAKAPGLSIGHFGLLGMQERAERSGASFSIQSRKGDGTSIIVEVPEKTGKRQNDRKNGESKT